MKLSYCDDVFLEPTVPLHFFKPHYLCDSLLFLSVPVCLCMLCGTWSLAEHSILHDTATLQSCFDTPLTHSVILSLFLASLLPLVLFPPSLPVTVNLTPANTGSSKCTANKCVGTVLVGVLEEMKKSERKKSGGKSREHYDQVDTKDADTHTHNYIPSKCQPL